MRDDTPVLIGAGQFTFRGLAENSFPPLELLKIAAKRAVADAGLGGAVLARLDALAVVAFSIDASGGLSKLPHARLSDPRASFSLANPHSRAGAGSAGFHPHATRKLLTSGAA